MQKSFSTKNFVRRESTRIAGALLLYFLLSTLIFDGVPLVATLIMGESFTIFRDCTEPVFSDLLLMLSYVTSFAVPILILSRGSEVEWRFVRPKLRFLVLILPLLLAMLQVGTFVSSIFGPLFRAVGIRSYETGITLPDSTFRWVLFVVQYILLPAVFEELLFRGVILDRLRRFGELFAVLSSGVLFAVLHLQIAALPGVFLMAVCFGYLTVVSESLIPSMVLHALNNLLAIGDSLARQYLDSSMVQKIYSVIFIAGLMSVLLLTLEYMSERRKQNGRFQLKKPLSEEREERWRIFISLPMILFFFIAGRLMLIMERR